MAAMLNSIPSSEPQGGEAAEDGCKAPYLQSVPAVDQAIRLLFSLVNTVGGEASLTELSRQVGISKSKGLAILNTLRNAGLVMRSDRTKNYRLGPNVLLLSQALINNTDLGLAASPYLEQLAAETGCSVHMGVVSGETLFVLPAGTRRAEPTLPLTWDSGTP
jgi:DNA-binding IclR family transcriptional regulator